MTKDLTPDEAARQLIRLSKQAHRDACHLLRWATRIAENGPDTRLALAPMKRYAFEHRQAYHEEVGKLWQGLAGEDSSPKPKEPAPATKAVTPAGENVISLFGGSQP